ncbi:MAG: PorV/PorQ family protein [Bacteroidales bacterium]
MRKNLLLFLCIIQGNLLFSQVIYPTSSYYQYNISAAFLEFCTDPVAGAMGETLAAASPFYQYNGLIQNPALLAMNDNVAGFFVSYTPWMRQMTPGLNILDLKAIYPVANGTILGYRFRNYNLNEFLLLIPGSLESIDGREFFHQISWGQNLSDNFSGGISLKYFQSNLGKYTNSQGFEVKPLSSFAFDLGVNYDKEIVLSEKTMLNILIAGSIRNFGPRIKYNNDPDEMKDFLPSILGIGVLINRSQKLNDKLKIDLDFAYQADKFLVPSPPVYDEEGQVILKGMNPDISPLRALYQSFYDAPNGFKEELMEIVHKGGMEFRLSNSKLSYIALRLGRVNGHKSYSIQRYNTYGVGAGWNDFSIDFKLINIRPHPIKTWTIMMGYRIILDKKYG